MELTLEEAKDTMNLDDDAEMTLSALTTFRSMVEDTTLHRLVHRQLVVAKHTILRNYVSTQMKERKFFDLDSPFGKDTCPSCKGAGEIYRFRDKTVNVNCHICAGHGMVDPKTVPCYHCADGKTSSCKYCKGTKEIKVYEHFCSECRGKGVKKKVVKSHHIKSTTPCKHCEELGYIPAKARKKSYTPPLKNPVISSSDAAALSEMIKENK